MFQVAPRVKPLLHSKHSRTQGHTKKPKISGCPDYIGRIGAWRCFANFWDFSNGLWQTGWCGIKGNPWEIPCRPSPLATQVSTAQLSALKMSKYCLVFQSPKYCVLKEIQHTPVDFRWFERIYFTLPAREDPMWASQFKGNHLAPDLRARFKHAAVGWGWPYSSPAVAWRFT